MSGNGLAVARRHVETDQPQRALEALATLDADHATSVEAFDVRACALIGLERYAAASKAVREGLADHPNEPRLLFLLSIAEEQRGDVVEAERAILAALGVYPDDQALLAQYASVLQRGGDLDKAQRIIETALEIGGADERLQLVRIQQAYLRSNNREAKRLSQELLEANPQSPDGHRWLGALQVQGGEARPGAARLGEAVRLEPAFDAGADAARYAREASRWWYFPLHVIDRFGAGPLWVGFVIITIGLRAAGAEAVALPFIVVWLVFCVWSWVAGGVLKARTKD